MTHKILVVEDDRDIALVVGQTLKEAGYTVFHAYDPKEAWDLLHQHKPDLVILDIMMPTGTEGFQLVWRIRSDEADSSVRNVPIVVLTSLHEKTPFRFYTDRYDASYGPGEFLPVQDFLDKPVEPKILLERIRSLLPATESSPQSPSGSS
ncbi:MAG: response regulator [Armatimonadetes bacterium]|nr:response regulator [Armatimonadota bacterium]MDW8122395.1 response regulator [Armatimonadota bacterium]